MDSKEMRAAKAQEMLRHVQESLKELQNLKKRSFVDIEVNEYPGGMETDYENNLLSLSALKVSVSSCTPSQLFETNLTSPQEETPPINYVSIKDTLDSFLYDTHDQSHLVESKDLQLDSMATELRQLTSVQDQALHDLSTDLDTLVLENKLLNERNQSLLSENEKLQQMVENLSQETEQLKHQILSMRSKTLLEFETFHASNAGTSVTIPCLDIGTDVNLGAFIALTDATTESSAMHCKDASAFSSMADITQCPNIPPPEFHLTGDNIENASPKTIPSTPMNMIISSGDAPKKVGHQKKKMGKGILNYFRRQRKGKYNVSSD